MRYGVVMFDDEVRKSSGNKKRVANGASVSIDGGTSRRIVSVSELESDVKWLTNFGFTDFNANGLGRNPNFYFSGFLRTEFRAIAEEIGAGSEQLSADKTAEMMSTLFGRVMRVATGTLGVDLKTNSISTKGLADFIAARIINRNKIPDEINTALSHAYQTYTTVMARVPRDWKKVMLRTPRYLHALDVLSTPVPSESQWVYLQNARLPESNSDRIGWCLGNELPVLANVVVKPRRGEYGSLISYNAGAANARTWVCQPELLMLAQYCDVEVIGAFVCEAGFEAQKEIESFPDFGDFTLASFSLGLIAENFWVSMASPRTSPTNQKFFPPRAIWYRATDRISMFMQAVKLQREKFQVYSYGLGNVTVYYPPGATKDMTDFALAMGLDVPAATFAEIRTELRLNEDE
ncbi:hypothetical protein R70006_05002 [Paraburkholderia domus]|uniref:hypothetical protein n=1 Tax=Paraburkholderia domus TaxID=2793075 RepID=UPI0019123043|nr:hypothetical protein [Paraburkholderia domus]MBK5051762.1 hypothetical protein [Burkholderia sp. R-70006]CAE6794409.1 hypothetical protein R70006_05002 [Paraburkholderia domus]